MRPPASRVLCAVVKDQIPKGLPLSELGSRLIRLEEQERFANEVKAVRMMLKMASKDMTQEPPLIVDLSHRLRLAEQPLNIQSARVMSYSAVELTDEESAAFLAKWPWPMGMSCRTSRTRGGGGSDPASAAAAPAAAPAGAAAAPAAAPADAGPTSDDGAPAAAPQLPHEGPYCAECTLDTPTIKLYRSYTASRSTAQRTGPRRTMPVRGRCRVVRCVRQTWGLPVL